MADRRAFLLLGPVLLAGCSMAPTYAPPATPAPVAFREAGPWVAAQPASIDPTNPWWTTFNDPVLDGLEARLTNDTPALAEALARADRAHADLIRARADLYPDLSIGGSVTDNRQSDNRPLRGSNQPDLYPADTLSGSAGYELDLWGRVRNAVAAGKATAEASADDVAAIRLSLQAQLASAYIALRGYDREAELLRATVDAYRKADAMTGRRFSAGIANGIETGESGAQLAEANAQLADVENRRAVTEHAIAGLIGVPASTFSLPAATTALAMPAVPLDLPSHLLERRPDVAAAERRMYAANRDIGVAKAAFFPSIGLGGSGGWQNTGVAGLLTAPNIFWGVGPNMLLNVFDGGRRRGKVAAARADWDRSVAQYRGTVVRAFQDVEDGLSRLHHLGDEALAESQAVDQAAQVERLSLNRYTKGAVNYLNVITAQTTALRVRRQSIALDTLRLQTSVSLFRALGGGWRGGERLAVSPEPPRTPSPPG